MTLKMLLAAAIVTISIPTIGQVVPEVQGDHAPLTVGVGYSNYNTNLSGRVGGPMFWADWKFFEGPSPLHGLGVEVEGRDLNYNRTGSVPNLRMDTISGGPIYALHINRIFNPYAKFLLGFGSIDFISSNPNYKHDTRALYAPAGGLEYSVYKDLSVRGDYEYQFWTNFFNHHALNPNGVTIGISYKFGRSYEP